jgi:hypothetical protein
MINYELALLLAIAAFVYSNLLTDENAILNRPYHWLWRFFKTDERMEVGKPVHPLFMVLMYCEKCVAGQWAFWLHLVLNWHRYNLLEHVLFTLFTIMAAAVVKEAYTKIKHT